jgi:hypothetical protein
MQLQQQISFDQEKINIMSQTENSKTKPHLGAHKGLYLHSGRLVDDNLVGPWGRIRAFLDGGPKVLLSLTKAKLSNISLLGLRLPPPSVSYTSALQQSNPSRYKDITDGLDEVYKLVQNLQLSTLAGFNSTWGLVLVTLGKGQGTSHSGFC